MLLRGCAFIMYGLVGDDVIMPVPTAKLSIYINSNSDKHTDKILSIYHGKRAQFSWKITIQREQENGPSFPWKKSPIFLESNHTKRAGKWALFFMEKGPHLPGKEQ